MVFKIGDKNKRIPLFCLLFDLTPYTLTSVNTILHTVLYTFPKVLTGRICFTIKSIFSW